MVVVEDIVVAVVVARRWGVVHCGVVDVVVAVVVAVAAAVSAAETVMVVWVVVAVAAAVMEMWWLW